MTRQLRGRGGLASLGIGGLQTLFLLGLKGGTIQESVVRGLRGRIGSSRFRTNPDFSQEL